MHVHKYMYVYRHTRVSLSLCVCARHQRFGGGKRQEGGGRRRVMPSSVCIVQVVQEKFNATVIYGDTDSVMVNFHCGEGPDAVKKALELGTQAAAVDSTVPMGRARAGSGAVMGRGRMGRRGMPGRLGTRGGAQTVGLQIISPRL